MLFFVTMVKLMEVWPYFLEIQEYDFSKLFGLIVNTKEKISTTKKNAIHIVFKVLNHII